MAGMVIINSRTCDSESCTKRPYFGMEGTRKVEFCLAHKRAGMVNIYKTRCAFEGCSTAASFRKAGGKKKVCSTHKTPGMVPIGQKTCSAQGCFSASRFGKARGRGEFCETHKTAGMVAVGYKTCAAEGCSIAPHFGKPGGKREVCKRHKTAEMVVVSRKACAAQGCSKSPSFGKAGGKAEFCFNHKTAGMVNLTCKRCAAQGCSVTPSFGKEGSNKVEFCCTHKKAGMVSLLQKLCASEGCSKRRYYGKQGSNKTEFCRLHKMAGMVAVHVRKCAREGCTKQPYFGTQGNRKMDYCTAHKTADMVYKGWRQRQTPCSPNFMGLHQAPAPAGALSSSESARESEVVKEIEEGPRGHAAFVRSSNRVATVEQVTQQSSDSSDGRISRGKRRQVLGGKERDSPREGVKAFHEDLDAFRRLSKVSKCSAEAAGEGRGGLRQQDWQGGMPNVIAAEKDVSATSPQSVVTDLPMVASPTAVVVASDVAAEAGIGATGLSPTLVEAHLEARGLDESVGLYDITRERARYQAVAHLDCLETSTIAIKAELYSQARNS